MIFAGAFAFRPGILIPEALRTQLQQALVRHPRPTRLHSEETFFLAAAGLQEEPAFQIDASGSLSALSGNPLLTEHKTLASLPRQLDLWHAAASARRTDAARSSRGTYCFLHHNLPEPRLWLVADHVGLRPIYYAVQDGILLFSSALRILEDVPMLRKRLSIEGMAEWCGLDFLLGDHTFYEDIFVLRENEILEVTAKGISHLTYDSWAEPAVIPQDIRANAAHLAAVFQEAVDLRLSGRKNAVAYLSGGLDSRSIVAALLAKGANVTALNFSPADAQDHAFAEGFARAAGPALQLHCFKRGPNPNFSLLAAEAMATIQGGDFSDRSIWSGDGGSVGLGHVYMNEPMVDRLESGDVEGTARLFLRVNRLGIPTRIFSGPVRKRLEGYLVKTITEELKRRPRRDAARSLYLFLLFNDQRRHLFKHFETMDEHGLEFELPFFDAKFLAAVAAMPVRSGILHRLYMEWFNHLPAFARETPWQTYPGHVPCPLSANRDLGYQWAPPAAKAGLAARLKTAQALLESIGSRDLPPAIFSRQQLTLAALSHLAGARDLDYVLEMVRQFQQYHRRCYGLKTTPTGATVHHV